MAQLSATQMQDAIVNARANNLFLEFEGRLSNYGAFQSGLDGASLLLPPSAVKNAKNSGAQITKIPVWNKSTASIITARACEITGANPVSAFQSLTYATKGFEITVSETVADGNYMDVEAQFVQGLRQGLRGVLNAWDIASVAKLETSKSGVLATSTLAAQASGAYVIEDIDDTYYDIPTIMRLNDLGGRYANVTNTEAAKTILKYESQGVNNAINLRGVLEGTLPSAGNYMHYLTNNITLGANREVHYVFPEGAFGIFQWNPKDFTERRSTSAGKLFYTFEDPILGLRWNVIEETTCVDLTSVYGAGYEASIVTKYQFTVDLALAVPYSSDSSSPIIKFTYANPA